MNPVTEEELDQELKKKEPEDPFKAFVRGSLEEAKKVPALGLAGALWVAQNINPRVPSQTKVAI